MYLFKKAQSQKANPRNQTQEAYSKQLTQTLNFLALGFSRNFGWYFLPFHQEPALNHQPGEEINFLEAIFSVLFGDGDPNANLLERSWQQLGALIQQHRGVLVAEQIVPYLTTLPSHAIRQSGNESYVLPLLVQFNGIPQVSETGEIVYQFPELQTTAKPAPPRSRPPTAPLHPALDEKVWLFSRANVAQIQLAIGLGLVNLLVVLIVRTVVPANPEGLLGWIWSISMPLLVYSIGFLAVPAMRYLVLLDRNQKISERNFERKALVTQLQEDSPELARKLTFAQQFAQQTYLDDQDLAYTTEKDLITQEIEQEAEIDADEHRRK
jgi:hypothetical protein